MSRGQSGPRCTLPAKLKCFSLEHATKQPFLFKTYFLYFPHFFSLFYSNSSGHFVPAQMFCSGRITDEDVVWKQYANIFFVRS